MLILFTGNLGNESGARMFLTREVDLEEKLTGSLKEGSEIKENCYLRFSQ